MKTSPAKSFSAGSAERKRQEHDDGHPIIDARHTQSLDVIYDVSRGRQRFANGARDVEEIEGDRSVGARHSVYRAIAGVGESATRSAHRDVGKHSGVQCEYTYSRDVSAWGRLNQSALEGEWHDPRQHVATVRRRVHLG